MPVQLENRLENGEATNDEYRVNDSSDVAIKVLSTQDDPTMPVLTFRTIFLGLGFSAFGVSALECCSKKVAKQQMFSFYSLSSPRFTTSNLRL